MYSPYQLLLFLSDFIFYPFRVEQDVNCPLNCPFFSEICKFIAKPGIDDNERVELLEFIRERFVEDEITNLGYVKILLKAILSGKPSLTKHITSATLQKKGSTEAKIIDLTSKNFCIMNEGEARVDYVDSNDFIYNKYILNTEEAFLYSIPDEKEIDDLCVETEFNKKTYYLESILYKKENIYTTIGIKEIILKELASISKRNGKIDILGKYEIRKLIKKIFNDSMKDWIMIYSMDNPAVLALKDYNNRAKELEKKGLNKNNS